MIKKNRIYIKAMVMVGLFSLSFLSAAIENYLPKDLPIRYSPTISQIIRKGKIVVGMVEKDQPPFLFERNGELIGYDVDLAKGIAERLGVEVEFNRGAKEFNDLIPMVVQGRADIVISKLSKTPSRARFVKFTKPYIVLKQGFLINRLGQVQYERRYNESLIYDFEKFKGKLGVIEGSSYVGFAENFFPRAEIVEFANWNDLVEAVFDNKILAGYRDELEVKKVVRTRNDAGLKIQSVLFKDTKDEIAMAVRWYENDLLSFLNTYIDSINLRVDAEWLINKYLK